SAAQPPPEARRRGPPRRATRERPRSQAPDATASAAAEESELGELQPLRTADTAVRFEEPAAPAPEAQASRMPRRETRDRPAARAELATAPARPATRAREAQIPLLDAATAESFARDLDAAEGPRPVGAVEQLFVERYAPLAETVNAGGASAVARRAVARFREGFERSYGEGFTAMRLTGKRPRMVLDVPELASRVGRLNGARTVQLLLVDGLRFDLGEHAMRAVRTSLGERAAFIERHLLWAALPTVTPVQLHLLGRGPAGLRDEEPQSEPEVAVQRGKNAAALRRVRIGQRDLVKLDLVEARLREAGAPFAERMAALAGELATVIARFAESLPARTLLYVFGDHGFRLQTEGDATGAATQGGASPEEAFVAGYAFLLGDVH
ncbi:MAG: hypothetical protein HY908_22010, partial [Myxococcales bacterium]|nr:hypothetical protein [Myxococcales bacterium]